MFHFRSHLSRLRLGYCKRGISFDAYKAVQLKNRKVIRVWGSDCFSFVQSLFSNDLRKLETNYSLYGYILNVTSKVLADIFVYRLGGNLNLVERELVLTGLTRERFGNYGEEEEELFLECDADLAVPVAKTLYAIKIRKNVKILIDESVDAWVVYPDIPVVSHQKVDWTPPLPGFLAYDILFSPDPRLPLLGYRFLTRLGCRDIEKLQKFLSHLCDKPIIESTASDYRRYRYKLGIPEGFRDFDHAYTYGLEANGDLLGCFSTSKGFFSGENAARRKEDYVYQTTKRIVPIEFDMDNKDEECQYLVPPKSLIMTSDGDRAGDVRCISGRFGLASVKVSCLNQAKLEVHHPQSSKMAHIYYPYWWPPRIRNAEPTKFEVVTNMERLYLR